MMEYHFKPKFKERFRKLLGRELNTFLEYQKKPMKETIRINTLKISREELVKKLESRGWKLKEIPWYEDGLLVEKRKEELGNTLEYFLGYYYSQGPASMIPSLVLDPKPGEIVLDLCAAPGSKTTQMAQLMKNKGVIIANDKSLSRISILRSNLQRCGVVNTIVTRMDGRMFKNVKQEFDRVLVDAPCSSEGTMRENPHLIKEWNLYTIKKLSNLQKRLIEAGFMRLKEGGVLVYSTCTLAPEENEKVIDYLVRKWDAKIEKIKLKNVKRREGVTEWKGKEFVDEIKRCWRIYPQDNDTEGFFIARIRK
jgi:NOL1/NOP2/sun family putative RNA methylase